jgi:GT2 family glycosyltransferase
MEKIKSTAIIILNYNNYNDTINCIESVEKYNTAPIKYIIVDNGSSKKDSVICIDKFLKKSFHDKYKCIIEGDKTDKLTYVTFLISKTNDGYAEGNNKGLRLANIDDEIENILILNNDILFVQDIIPELLNSLKSLDKAAIVSPLLYKKGLKELDYTCARLDYKCSYVFFQYLFLYIDFFKILSFYMKKQCFLINNPKLLNHRYVEIEMPSGSCMLMNKKFFYNIGFFDPNTFLYFEENILFQKIRNKGYKNYLISNLKCIHLGASSSKTVPSLFTMKCNIDSCYYYFHKYKKNKFLCCFIKMMRPLILLKIKLRKNRCSYR